MVIREVKVVVRVAKDHVEAEGGLESEMVEEAEEETAVHAGEFLAEGVVREGLLVALVGK